VEWKTLDERVSAMMVVWLADVVPFLRAREKEKEVDKGVVKGFLFSDDGGRRIGGLRGWKSG
jgi:hypothetical protein